MQISTTTPPTPSTPALDRTQPWTTQAAATNAPHIPSRKDLLTQYKRLIDNYVNFPNDYTHYAKAAYYKQIRNDPRSVDQIFDEMKKDSDLAWNVDMSWLNAQFKKVNLLPYLQYGFNVMHRRDTRNGVYRKFRRTFNAILHAASILPKADQQWLQKNAGRIYGLSMDEYLQELVQLVDASDNTHEEMWKKFHKAVTSK